MARQVIDTSPPIGTPAPTAFSMINAMMAEIYGWGAGGALAKLIGGNYFQGNQAFSGALTVQPAAGQDQIIIREAGFDGRALIDAVNDANTLLRPVTLRGSEISLSTPVTVASDFTLSNGRIGTSSPYPILAGTGGGAVVLRPNGLDNGVGEMQVSSSGAVTAVSFNPTSSADVKDFIEGYAGDADMDLNRLVVITHKYRPEFLDSEKTYLSLLAENVQSVVPIATDGNYDVVEKEPYERPVTITVQVPNEDGDGTQDKEMETFETAWREVTRHVPMNVNLMSIVALCVRAHQSKDRRIRELEAAVADLQAIVRPAAGQTE